MCRCRGREELAAAVRDGNELRVRAGVVVKPAEHRLEADPLAARAQHAVASAQAVEPPQPVRRQHLGAAACPPLKGGTAAQRFACAHSQIS